MEAYSMNFYECNFCNKKFQTKKYLYHHIKFQIDERPYKCNICDKAFKRQMYLTGPKIHTTKNSEETIHEASAKENQNKNYNTFECHFCKEMFMSKKSLSIHIKQLSFTD